jgi:hypothetical protein
MPVQGVTVRMGEYGARRADGEIHHGLDLAVPEGTSVVSPGVGTVLEVGHDARSGNFVKIDHGDGLVSSYAHLSAATVKVGDQVTPGQQIALSGNTGHSTGAHVHWRTKVNGQDVNPQSVAFPQGNAAQGEGAVAQVAQALNAPPADAPPAPPVIARGPALFDISGQAEQIGTARYRIQQAQEFEITARVRTQRAQLQSAGQDAMNYLYGTHGTDLLLGHYDTASLVKELAGQGYKPQEIGAALNILHENTTDSAGVMTNKMRIHEADPNFGKSILDLATEGERDGYSVGYEHKVGQAVLRGDISGSDGASMVSRALSRTRALEGEARADAREKRAREAADPSHVHSYAQLKQQSTYLAGLAAQNYQSITGRPIGDFERQRVGKQITDAMGAYLAAHPGEYDGAVVVARQVVAAHGQRTLAKRGGQPAPPRPAPGDLLKTHPQADQGY